MVSERLSFGSQKLIFQTLKGNLSNGKSLSLAKRNYFTTYQTDRKLEVHTWKKSLFELKFVTKSIIFVI